jgi:hypothetical protein
MAAHRLPAVCPEPTRTPAAASSPSRANGRNRSRWGFTVYSSAEPWIFTANGKPARVRITGPMIR